MGIGLLILRAVVGLTLAAHGAQKLFGWFGGPGLEKTGAGMEKLGFVPGGRSALRAGLSETVGGLFLALGLATPGAAAIVFGVMVVAGVSAHLKQGFFVQNHGYEYTLILGVAGLSAAFTGAGPFSFDALLGLPLAGARWGLAAFVVGLAGSAFQLALRQRPAAQKSE
jgi:putative oxidoreductase